MGNEVIYLEGLAVIGKGGFLMQLFWKDCQELAIDEDSPLKMKSVMPGQSDCERSNLLFA